MQAFENFDDLFTTPSTPQEDKAAWAARKQQEREALYAQIDEAVSTMASDGTVRISFSACRTEGRERSEGSEASHSPASLGVEIGPDREPFPVRASLGFSGGGTSCSTVSFSAASLGAAGESGDLKKFCQEAKKYGVLYCVLKDRDATDGITDILVRAFCWSLRMA